jgi:hypothetical protein
MWDDDLGSFVLTYRLTRRSAQTLKCTAEHLTARCEGGKDRADNIVAACLICNHRRHQMKRPKSPQDYRRHVQGRVQKGKWHSFPANCSPALKPPLSPQITRLNIHEPHMDG